MTRPPWDDKIPIIWRRIALYKRNDSDTSKPLREMRWMFRWPKMAGALNTGDQGDQGDKGDGGDAPAKKKRILMGS